MSLTVMLKNANAALQAKAKVKAWTFVTKAKVIKFGLEGSRGQGRVWRTT